MSIVDSKSNLPLNNRNMTQIIDGLEYDISECELIGHRITDPLNPGGLSGVNKFYMLYRTKGGRYVKYNQEKGETTSINPLAANVSLTPLTKAEAEALYPKLSDMRMSFNEAFKRIVEA